MSWLISTKCDRIEQAAERPPEIAVTGTRPSLVLGIEYLRSPRMPIEDRIVTLVVNHRGMCCRQHLRLRVSIAS